MKISSFLTASFVALVVLCSSRLRAETVVYVSESKDKKIAIFSLDEETGRLERIGEIEVEGAPGSLVVNRDRSRLYASFRTASKIGTLAVTESGELKLLGSAPGAGNASYLYLDRNEKWVLSACYSEGLAASSKVEEGIVKGPPVSVLEVGKKAHCIQTDPANRFAFCPQPVELNQVVQMKFDAASGMLTLNDPAAMKAGERHGPRHLQFHPNGKWFYVVNEQGKSVTLCDYDADSGVLTMRQTVSTVPESWDPMEGSCADIEISRDGRFVYASNRGHDSIAAFSIDLENGDLTSLGQTPTGETPRSFNLIEGAETFLIAAGQKSNTLSVYARDSESGLLTLLYTYDCGQSPAWVLGVKLPK